jgi:hypothetical protein
MFPGVAFRGPYAKITHITVGIQVRTAAVGRCEADAPFDHDPADCISAHVNVRRLFVGSIFGVIPSISVKWMDAAS